MDKSKMVGLEETLNKSMIKVTEEEVVMQHELISKLNSRRGRLK